MVSLATSPAAVASVVPLPGAGRGLGASSDPTRSERFRDGWMGEVVSFGGETLRKCPKAQKWGETGAEEAGFEDGSLGPLSQHPPESK